MFCRYCGKELPGDAEFCLNCGKPVGGQIVSGPAQWETCSISWWSKWGFMLSNSRFQFQAMATGSKGYYKVAESHIITKYLGIQTDEELSKAEGKRELDEALNELIQKLTVEGWEPVGRGAYWWDHRFRRQIR